MHFVPLSQAMRLLTRLLYVPLLFIIVECFFATQFDKRFVLGPHQPEEIRIQEYTFACNKCRQTRRFTYDPSAGLFRV